MKTDTPRPIYLKDHQPSDYLIDTVALDVQLYPTKTRVKSRLKIRPNPDSRKKNAPLRLDGENLELEGVKLANRKLGPKDYSLSKRYLTIQKVPNRPFTIEITTTCNPKANNALSGLYLSRGIYSTQCEAQGFRRITYYLDRPDVLAVFTVRIEGNKRDTPILLANGNPIDSGNAKGKGRHFAVWHDPHPKPSYLFAMVGGDLACVKNSFKTMSKRNVELRIYVEPGKEDRCDWAMDSLKRSMRWDEKRFGREYDLDVFMIVAVSDFNMGAMENKGLNIFNDKLILARPDTATDNEYAAIEAVIAHEYFHNWTGNRITCRDWFQLCLKEGLTVFRDQEFTADHRSRAVKRIQDVRMLKTHQFPEDAGPLAHPVRPASYIEINNFYTPTVYEKGAELCHMILTMVGRTGFRKGMNLYFERHDGEAATVEDFINAMADANNIDLGQFMNWYNQSGTPELVCAIKYDRRRNEASLNVNQINPSTPDQTKKQPLHIPLKIGLLDSDGEDLPLTLDSGETVKNGLLHIHERAQTFRFSNIPTRPVPSILRGFSAPVRLTTELSDRDLEFLIAHDNDEFNRWQAAQTYATRTLIHLVDAVRAGKKSRKGGKLAKAIGLALTDETLEPAYRAEFLNLPSESDIAREIGANIDPEAIHLARKQLRHTICRELYESLVETYENYAVKGRYSPNAKACGKRALRNIALSLLSATGRDHDIERAVLHYSQAKNMTDKTIALAILSQCDTPVRKAILDDFYQSWKDDHLVIDKWFAFQATSSLPETLEAVKGLTSHELFSLKAPNKVRSLIGAFANSNPVNFNRRDGAGYNFIAETILEIDAFNPQIAARLSGVFKSWRMLEIKRRKLAKRALEHIAKHKGLSKDTFEIVSKTLEA